MAPQVVIIGGGFAGLVLALSLKKHGMTSAVYETRSEDYRAGGNIALAPNALRVLDHLGVYDRLHTKGFNYSQLSFVNTKGAFLGGFLNGSRKVYNFDALRIARPIARQELAQVCAERGIPIYYNKKCSGIVSEDEATATISFADGETVTAEFVIGADGIHSHVRDFISPGSEPYFSGLMGLGGSVHKSKLESTYESAHVPSFGFGNSGSFAIIPDDYAGTEAGYFATIQADADRGRQGWAELEANKPELRRMLESVFLDPKNEWSPLVRELVSKTDDAKLNNWPFMRLPTQTRWSSARNRVIMLGDAAHAIPPTGGQGAAMALEDAETLAYALKRHAEMQSESTSAAAGLDPVIRAWEAVRIERVGKVLEFTTRNGDMRKTTSSYVQQATKEWLMWAAWKWQGPVAGLEWLYSYNGETILGQLP